MIEMKNRQIFIGKVENDIFENGYLCLYNSEEIQNVNENGEKVLGDSFNIEKIFYFYKDQDNNNQFIYQFENQFYEVLYQNMKKVQFHLMVLQDMLLLQLLRRNFVNKLHT